MSNVGRFFLLDLNNNPFKVVRLDSDVVVGSSSSTGYIPSEEDIDTTKK